MNIEKDFEDFVHLLNLHEVDYMVVGGYALAFHGEPRTTGDMGYMDCMYRGERRQNGKGDECIWYGFFGI